MAESSSSSSSNAPAPIAEIDHGPSKLDQFLDNHQKKLIIAAILIALGVAAYVVYDGVAQGEAREAGAALLEAEKISDYQDVIKKYPESKSADSALPLMADLQWSDSQPDAIASLEKYIANNPESTSLATAQVSLGLRLLEQGKTDQATEILTDVAESDAASYISPLASIALGDIAKAAGKLEEAKKWYEKAQEDPTNQGNTFKDLAEARLLLVNAQPPVKIKPALPEPPQPAAPTPPAPLTAPTPPAPIPTPPTTPGTPTTPAGE